MTFESEKYIVFTDNGNRIFTHKGFRRIDKLNNNTIRLFDYITNAKEYLEKHVAYYKQIEIEFKKVKITYEVIE